MPLTVEAGTGVAGADSYVSLAEYAAYTASLGWQIAATDAENEVLLRRAFQAINRNWRYRGNKLDSRQSGAFPRTSGIGLPAEVKDAQCEMAHLIAGGLDPFKTIDRVITKERSKIGPIEEEVTSLPAGEARLIAVEGLLRAYLASGSGQVRLVRG